MSRNPTDYYRGARRALTGAVARGEREKARRLTKKVIALQQQLFGKADEPNPGKPFDDSVDFIGR